MTTTRNIFFGPQGLRAGWGLLIYFVLFNAMGALLFLVLQRVMNIPDNPPWTPGLIFGGEAVQLVFALVATAILGRIEKRSFAAYGVAFRSAFGRLFWEGALWGILSIAAVIGMMALAGGYTVSGLAVHAGSPSPVICSTQRFMDPPG